MSAADWISIPSVWLPGLAKARSITSPGWVERRTSHLSAVTSPVNEIEVLKGTLQSLPKPK